MTLTRVSAADRTEPVDDARVRLVQAQAAANAAAVRYEQAVRRRDETTARIDELQASLPTLRAQAADLRARVATRAGALYRNTSPAELLELLGSDDISRAARRAALTQAVAAADDRLVRQLQQITEQVDGAENEARQLQAVIDDLLPQLEAERAEFDQRVADADAALETAETAGVLVAPGHEPVLGQSQLSPDQLVGWYAATGTTPRLAGTTIAELAALYIEEGQTENVRGDVAFGQAYLETGGFTHGGDDNNYAGLGACDTCTSQRRFPTARDGVRAQIQHLRNYADKTSRAATLHNPPSPWWYGQDPAVAARNYDTFFAKGWAPTWQLMGHGNWATDPNYATKILAIYQRMVLYAQTHP
jgi:Mannosyl-glycoprotein endo-beta-N-acetylglucosaminidase